MTGRVIGHKYLTYGQILTNFQYQLCAFQRRTCLLYRVPDQCWCSRHLESIKIKRQIASNNCVQLFKLYTYQGGPICKDKNFSIQCHRFFDSLWHEGKKSSTTTYQKNHFRGAQISIERNQFFDQNSLKMRNSPTRQELFIFSQIGVIFNTNRYWPFFSKDGHGYFIRSQIRLHFTVEGKII